jgi:hypothetical protein
MGTILGDIHEMSAAMAVLVNVTVDGKNFWGCWSDLQEFVAVPPHVRSFAHGAVPNGGSEPSRCLKYYLGCRILSRTTLL